MQSIVLKNGKILQNGELILTSIRIENDKITEIGDTVSLENATVYKLDGQLVTSGFVDVHVHFRSPGLEYKETIQTGTKAAAKGGYTAVCTMPNLKPAPDSLENLQKQLDIINKEAIIKVFPFASITKGQKGQGELVDFKELAPYVAGYSDDGLGVQSASLMFEAMKEAKKVDLPIVAHCEEDTLLYKGYVNDDAHNRSYGRKGIPSISETVQIARDVVLAENTGAKYHVCHISGKESVRAIEDAKRHGIDVSTEVSPHHLLLTSRDIKEDDGNYKMNPPLKEEADRLACINGIKNGTIQMIATDHAPHGEQEKSLGLKNSAFGIVGLETAFPLLYTHLVKTGEITLEKLIELFSENPAMRFNLPIGKIAIGGLADLTIVDLQQKKTINVDSFVSKGKNSPFNGYECYGFPVMTIVNGKVVFNELQKEMK